MNITPQSWAVERKFFALDLDRTLCDTDAVVRELTLFLSSSQSELKQALLSSRQAVERTGGSFDVAQGLMHHAGSGALEILEQFVAHVEQTQKELWLPGAKEFMAEIEAEQISWGIMTFGGEVWQQDKARLLGIPSERVMVMPEPGSKGRVIASWQQADGTYQLPAVYGSRQVRLVVLADDKLSELAGLPQDGSARGYHVRRYAKSLPGEPFGQPNPMVRPVDTLNDIIKLEKDL